jgi:Zn-dependent protease with chaperone function
LKLLALVLPSLAALAATMLGSFVQRRLPPHVATRLLATLAVTGASGVVAIVGLVAFGWAGWCRALYTHEEVPVWIGLPALAALPTMLVAAAVAVRRWKASVHRRPHPGRPLELLHTDEPVAYAVPGRPGHIVVSVGMLSRLRTDERRVLLAHERSHLSRRHHRYLWAVEIASAAVPVLMPMRAQIRFVTERWADEDAAEAVGSRTLVARAISRAALAQIDHGAKPALAMATFGVRARVDALLSSGADRRWTWVTSAVSVAAVAVAVAGSAVQAEQFWLFVGHICSA